MSLPTTPATNTDDPGAAQPYRGPRACAWPPRPQDPARVRLISAEELRSWLVHEDERLLVIAKPGDVVVHPSKAGPWSSLAGAIRETFGLARAHPVFRLDRETSGVVVFAKDERTASRLQVAMQARRVRKTYLALLTGELVAPASAPVRVEQPLGDDTTTPVFIKTCVRADGKPAASVFTTLITGGGFSIVRVGLETGRKHQIRAHAHWLGYPVVGDKLYGPDPLLYLEFVRTSWTPALAERLLLPRQALHCAEIDLGLPGFASPLRAPVPPDLLAFAAERIGPAATAELTQATF
jgi:23S rRNA pseudouridine1911/1915/1917 synthase